MAMMSAIASSTTERVLENGALKAATPWSVARARSIWLVPMQKAPIASRSGRASRTRAVTSVLERMPSRSMPSRASISSSSSSAEVRLVTSTPAPSRSVGASGCRFSRSSAFMPPPFQARQG